MRPRWRGLAFMRDLPPTKPHPTRRAIRHTGRGAPIMYVDVVSLAPAQLRKCSGRRLAVRHPEPVKAQAKVLRPALSEPYARPAMAFCDRSKPADDPTVSTDQWRGWLALLRCGVGCIVLLPSADRSRSGPLKMPPRVREGECHPRWQLSGRVTELPQNATPRPRAATLPTRVTGSRSDTRHSAIQF